VADGEEVDTREVFNKLAFCPIGGEFLSLLYNATVRSCSVHGEFFVQWNTTTGEEYIVFKGVSQR
jgi:hypothetical protein